MVARRTNSRRRRVLNEEMVRTEELLTKEQEPDSRKSKQLAYSSGANRRNQLKTTDLLPKRWHAFSAVVLTLITCIGLINLLAFYAPAMRMYIGQAGAESLAISGKGTLACWFTSFLLISAALASLQIYALRQHRRDDYQGSYRIWTWMALVFLIASVDCAVGLRGIANSVFEALTQRSFSHNPWLVLSIPMILAAIVAIRGLLEVRASQAAMVAVFLVWLTYNCAVVVQSPWVKQELATLDVPLVYGNCVLFATAGLLVAHFVYARFVYLHAHGLIEVVAKVEKASAKKAKSKTATTGSARTTARKSKKRTVAKEPDVIEELAAVEDSESEPAVSEPVVAKKKKAATSTRKSKTKATPARVQTKSQSPAKSMGSFGELSALLGKNDSETSEAKDTTSSGNVESDEGDEPQILSMSKAEKRRRRKLEKQRRKAA